jgi:hypothetical protein
MNVWWMRRLSSMQLVLGDTTAGRPIGEGRKEAVREHSTLSPKIQRGGVNQASPTWTRRPPGGCPLSEGSIGGRVSAATVLRDQGPWLVGGVTPFCCSRR